VGKLALDILNNVLNPRIAEAADALTKAARKLPIEDITSQPILEVTADPSADPNQRRR
jgi:hypothetical protein